MTKLTIVDLRTLDDEAFRHRFMWRPGDGPRVTAPRMTVLVDFINTNMPAVVAQIEDWSYQPSRKVGRLIRYTGRRRTGKRVAIYRRGVTGYADAGRPVHTHNPLEGIDNNWTLLKWICQNYERGRKTPWE